jgi:hypothetical protein
MSISPRISTKNLSHSTKCAKPQMGQKYLYKTSPRALKFTRSHLSYFSDSASFGILLGALSLSMSSSMDSQGFTFDITHHSSTITRDLWLKQSLCQQVKKNPNNYSHLQFQRGFPQVCEELWVSHEVSTTSA